MPKEHVKFKVTKDLSEKILQVIEMARNSGNVRRGTNEATKAIEKGTAQLVVIAEDVDPPEVVMHIPSLCEEKKIPFVYVPSKIELGRASGIDVPCASIAVADAGEGKPQLKDVIKEIEKAAKG
jgi:large subunit ribosomal protein L7Ae